MGKIKHFGSREEYKEIIVVEKQSNHKKESWSMDQLSFYF